jgi:hypothetical protein
MWKRQHRPPDWQEQFVIVMRATTKNDALVFEEAAGVLQRATGEVLLRFDHYARRSWWNPGGNAFERARAVLKHAMGRPEFAELLLFHEACNDNGYIREQALRALRGHQGRLACAAALLRAEDWVPPVAALAENLIADFAASERARYFFEFLPLILALRRKPRFARLWPAIERALLESKWREQRREAVRGNRGRIRRFALELTLTADADLHSSSLAAVARDPSPLVSSWALASACRVLTDGPLREVLCEGRRNVMAFVRADALRRYVNAGFADSLDVLLKAALDRSQTVRSTAAYHLLKRHGVSALPLWREKFDAGEMRDALTITFAEYGNREDESRLRSQLRAARARTRAAALRGLCAAGVPDADDLLAAALHDPASLVIGAATKIYARSSALLPRATLESAVAQTGGPRQTARLLSAARLLAKWDQIAFLLNRYLAAPPLGILGVERELERWLWMCNRSFAAATAGQATEIRGLLDELRLNRPSRQLESIAFHCSPLR